MLNKKIIAAAVAAAFAHGVAAAAPASPVDLDLDNGPVTYANDIVNYSLNADGMLEVENAGNLDVTVELGFTIGEGTSKYILFQLDGATFDAVPTLDVDGVAGSISQGGTVGSSFVIFEVAPTTTTGGDLDQDAVVTLSADDYVIDPTVTSTVSYKLLETAADAVAALVDDGIVALSSEDGEFTNTGTGSSGEFAVAGLNTATVSTTFTNFNGASVGATTAAVGKIDTDLIVADTTYNADGTETEATDYLADSQDITFTGDMSFGTWTLQSTDQCDGSGTTYGVTSTSATGGVITDFADTDLVLNDWTLCVVVDGTEKIEKGTYSVTLEDDELTDGIGEIKYDTTTIEVPYITNYYNQRIILVNTSSEDAEYSMSFQTENGTTATAGADATGTIPANGMIVLATQKDDIVTFDGRTRASATIEVESVDGNIQAATQTISSDGNSTDTVVLNANSVISYNSLVNLLENN